MALRQVYEENGALKSRNVAGSGSANADSTNYDNTLTGLPTNVQEAIDKTTDNISGLDTVELTATAAHAHAVGSTFLFIGQLVETTAAIAVGDTIAIGTNVTETSVLNLISKANSDLNNLDNYTNLSTINTQISYTIQLANCTGTITDGLTIWTNDKYAMIWGRLFVNNFIRTDSNPGFHIKLPITIQPSTFNGCGLGWSNNDTVQSALSEMLFADCIGDTIRITRSETHTNLVGTSVVFQIFRTIIAR